MRRRRKRLVTWLPNLARTTSGDSFPINWLFGSVVMDASGRATTEVELLVKDEYPDQADNVLSDYTQGGYLLQRVVGKLFVGMRQSTPTEPNAALPGGIVTASLEILRTNPDDNNPTGLANVDNYNALSPGNERDPWIWQRSWMLSNGNATVFTEPYDQTWGYAPYTNCEYGSVLDGPHVDAKTKRRVGPEERLALVITTQAATEHTQGFDDGAVDIIFQYRVLATPIRSSNRRNTSR